MERIKRTTDRYPYYVPVKIYYKDSVFDGNSLNISAGGMFINSELLPEIGVQISIKFDLPSIKPVCLDVFVRWYNNDGFGVQFAPIGAKETHAINEACKCKK